MQVGALACPQRTDFTIAEQAGDRQLGKGCAAEAHIAIGLSVETLAPVLKAGPAVSELLVLGMGASNALPPREVRQAFLTAGLGLEFLDTPAAARLYNLLTSEGRRVAAALIAV